MGQVHLAAVGGTTVDGHCVAGRAGHSVPHHRHLPGALNRENLRPEVQVGATAALWRIAGDEAARALLWAAARHAGDARLPANAPWRVRCARHQQADVPRLQQVVGRHLNFVAPAARGHRHPVFEFLAAAQQGNRLPALVVDLDRKRVGEGLPFAQVGHDERCGAVLSLEPEEQRVGGGDQGHVHRLPEDQLRAIRRTPPQQSQREVAGCGVLAGDPQQVDAVARQDRREVRALHVVVERVLGAAGEDHPVGGNQFGAQVERPRPVVGDDGDHIPHAALKAVGEARRIFGDGAEHLCAVADRAAALSLSDRWRTGQQRDRHEDRHQQPGAQPLLALAFHCRVLLRPGLRPRTPFHRTGLGELNVGAAAAQEALWHVAKGPTTGSFAVGVNLDPKP